MKKVFFSCVLIVVFIALGVSGLEAKKYDLFGYSDFIFLYGKHGDNTESSFLQNRTNLILSSEFEKRWNFFLNMEFNGAVEIHPDDFGVSQTDTKGRFQLEEAWASYTLSDAFVVKAGIFLAPFGSFNVRQDMSPTYISVRPPMIYDDDFRDMKPVHIIPGQCNLEISGRIVKRKTKFEYHVYAGNGWGTNSMSVDANLSKSIGTRLAFSYDENLKIGISSYFDNAKFTLNFTPTPGSNDKETTQSSYTEKRSLYSIDFDYTFSRFNLNGEYFYNHNRSEQFPTFNRYFYYVNFNMELVNKVKGYVERDFYKDRIPDSNTKQYLGKGVYKTIFGINYKPNWRVALKGEIQLYSFKDHFNPSYAVFMTSLSVVF